MNIRGSSKLEVGEYSMPLNVINLLGRLGPALSKSTPKPNLFEISAGLQTKTYGGVFRYPKKRVISSLSERHYMFDYFQLKIPNMTIVEHRLNVKEVATLQANDETPRIFDHNAKHLVSTTQYPS